MKPLQGAADGRNKCQSARSSAVSDGGREKRTKPFHLPDKQLERLCSQPSLLLAEQRVKARKFTSVLVTTKTAFTSFRHTLSYSRKPGLPPPSPRPCSKAALNRRLQLFPAGSRPTPPRALKPRWLQAPGTRGSAFTWAEATQKHAAGRAGGKPARQNPSWEGITHCSGDGWRQRSIRHVRVVIHIWHHDIPRITRVGWSLAV